MSNNTVKETAYNNKTKMSWPNVCDHSLYVFSRVSILQLLLFFLVMLSLIFH